ncbi:MAG: hypothetical protein AAGA76_14485 [Pseudomonadota bacterium]
MSIMQKNRTAISASAALFVALAIPTITSAQEFDWNDDFVQGRKTQSQSSGTFADNGLPGVRKNPFNSTERKKRCVEATLGELIVGSQQLPGDCIERPLTVFQFPTERR